MKTHPDNTEVLLAAMLVDPGHPTLEDAKEALNRVRGHITTGIFLGAVIDGLVRGEFSAHSRVERAFIGVQTRPPCVVATPGGYG